MKNILFIFVLSLYSIQGFASSCPDGSEPTKTISSDGTYFEFKCGNKKAEEFEDNSGILYADEAKEMLDDHVMQSELLKVPLPSHNRIIKDYERFLDYRNNRMAKNWNFTEYLWNQDPDGQLLTREVCKRILVEYRVPTTPTLEERSFKRCADYYSTTATLNLEEGVKLYQELLLEIASSKDDYWVYKDSGEKNFNPRDYNLWGVSSTFLMFYATNYDAFNFTEDERRIVENYYKEKAMKERLDRDGNGNPLLCPIKNPMSLSADNHKVNNCGSLRFRFAPAELALAIVMQDEELWAKGLWDLDYTLSMIEDEGFFVPLSAKGCRALGYTWDTSKLLSMNVEMLKLADFNLLDYETRHGKTVAEAYEMLFKQYEDITISNHIAEKGIGAASCGYKPFKTHDEFLFQEFGSSADYISKYAFFKDKAKLAEAYELGFVPMSEDFINWSIRFVTEKHPEWLADFDTPSNILVSEGTSAYFTVQPFEVFNANIMTEKDSIWHEKKKQLKIDAEKEDKSCKVSPLNGEYIAKWFVYDKNTGIEILSLDDCKGEFISGEFAGASNFMPSKELREDLTISYKTNGQITVKGDLDFRGDKKYVWLVGDINEGIVDSKNPRHPFRIELINKAQRDANIKKEKDERKAKIAQKKIIRDQACKDNEFNNEYVAKWFFVNVNNKQKRVPQGSELLTLDNCKGSFEGEGLFQPSNDLRKLLQVNYEPNGSIVVSGKLDLFEKGDARKTELKGDINSGEISGIWGFGDEIIVQLTKKPKASELFDGRYSFTLFRYAEDEADKIGNGFINISNGQITIDKKYRNLKTGETDLYDTFNGQVDKNGEVSGSVKLDIISSKERSEFYNFKGLISDKIWGESPVEDFFKVYLKLIRRPENETTSCNTKSFDGEYVASWFAESTKDDVGWEFVGKENIIFDSCKGKFEATEDFQPNKWFKMSKALRKDLNVFIRPDGTINIFGDLDLDYSEIQRINIKNNTQGGEVLGYFNTGWRLKVELKSK